MSTNMADVALIAGQAITTADVDSLFEKFTIKEIHEISKNTRFEIEKKKEDVRQMVGERYRDLIEAADTISEMKTSINRVNEHISAMEQQCTAIKKERTQFSNLPTGNRKLILEQYYAFAAQMKLLLDIPGQIWSLIEGTNFLAAAQLFLVARHVHTSLQVEPSAGIPFSAWHSLISRQWATISHFKAALVTECRTILQSPDVSAQLLAQCLSTLLVLGNNNNIHQVFSDFLEARTKCIEELFHHSKHGSSVREQVCQTLQLIISTLHLVYTVFLEDQSTTSKQETASLLRQSLDSITDPAAPSPLQLVTHHSSAMKYLPRSVMEFRVTLTNLPSPITLADIQKSCIRWIQQISDFINTGMTKVLSYITSIHGLSLVRDAIFEVMNTNEHKEQWDRMCQTLLERSLNLWEELFQPLFIGQVKRIVSTKLNSAFGCTFQQVSDFMKNMTDDRTNAVERDITSFLWSENPGDLPTNVGWISSSPQNLVDGGNLIMKARGYTPLSQSLCSSLNSQLENLLEDLTHFQSKSMDGRRNNEDGIYAFVTETTVESANKLLNKCRSLLGERPETPELQDVAVQLYISRVLVLARLWSGLTELCPVLQQCVASPSGLCDLPPRRLSTSRKSDAKILINTEWTKLRTTLMEESHNMLRLWKDVVNSHLRKHMNRVITSKDNEELLLCIPQWETIEIQEETEDGRMVTSTIRVPAQVSWPIMSILHHLCTEISRIGGHTIPKSILRELHSDVVEAVTQAYETLKLHNPLLQVMALQLLFDLQFINSLLVSKDDKATTTKIQALMESLESQVDPFDLDVFTPHIQTHLRRCVQRSLVLFGALTNPNKGGYLSTSHRLPSSSQTEQHNILCVTTTVPRFALLPLAGSSSDFSKSGELDVVTSKANKKERMTRPAAPLNAAAASSEPLKSTAASFFEAMSTGWFRN